MERDFKVLGINHVGLAPKNPALSRTFFSDLGLSFHGDELVQDQQTLTAMFSARDAAIDKLRKDDQSPRLEILEADAGNGPIAAFLAKRGSGIHHIALQVDSVDNALAYLLKKGVRMIDEKPRGGAHNTRIIFIHPEATGGLLVELVEETK